MRVIRGFKVDGQRGSSGSCNIDVVCSQGDDWWDEIPSVGVYTLKWVVDLLQVP